MHFSDGWRENGTGNCKVYFFDGTVEMVYFKDASLHFSYGSVRLMHFRDASWHFSDGSVRKVHERPAVL